MENGVVGASNKRRLFQNLRAKSWSSVLADGVALAFLFHFVIEGPRFADSARRVKKI